MRLLAFAQARDLLGGSESDLPLLPGDTPALLLDRHFPGTRATLPKGTRPALVETYATWDTPIPPGTNELAILPPVSGG